MPARTLRTVSTVLSWTGVGLLVVGAVMPALAPGMVEGGPPRTANGNADQALHDAAVEVRRRVAEFRDEVRTSDDHVWVPGTLFIAGVCLAIGGLVGRIASEKRSPDANAH